MIAVSTMVAPEAESMRMDRIIPAPTLATPNKGVRKIVSLNDLLICKLINAGRTSMAEIRRTPTMGIAAITTTPVRTLTR